MTTSRKLLTFAAALGLLVSLAWAADQTRPTSRPAGRPEQPAQTSQAEGGPRQWSNTGPWTEQPGGPKHKTFRSKLVQQDVGYSIWLPPQYEEKADARFPVVYHLHGIGGTESQGAPRYARLLGPAIEAGKCLPMIFVTVNGYRDSFYVDSLDKAVPMESIIIKELIPHIDATYRTVADRSGRGIDGFSMGGYGAMRLGLKYPEVFSSIVALGGAYIDENIARARGGAAFGGDMEFFRKVSPAAIARENAEKVRAGKVHIFMACGERDDLLGRNRQMDALLTELKIEHSFQTVPNVGHDVMSMYEGLGSATWEAHAQGFALAAASQPSTALASQPASRPSTQGRPRLWSNTPPWQQDLPGGPRHKTFHSELVKQHVGYTVWVPKQYEEKSDARFPVIYHLHGVGGNEVDGAVLFSRDLQKAMDAGKCPPSIFVMVNGYLNSGYVDSADGSVPMESIIIKELIPHIDKSYRTIASREGRGLVGFSMGGRGSMFLGLKHHDMFSSIVAMAGAFVSRTPGPNDPATVLRENADKVRGRMAILLACGDKDNLMDRNKQFDALLTELKIEHGFITVPDVGHEEVPMFNWMDGVTWATHAKGFGHTPPATQPATAQAEK